MRVPLPIRLARWLICHAFWVAVGRVGFLFVKKPRVGQVVTLVALEPEHDHPGEPEQLVRVLDVNWTRVAMVEPASGADLTRRRGGILEVPLDDLRW